MTESQGLENKPIHFNEFQEIEESEMNSGGMTIDSLLLPESHEGVLQNEVDEQDKQPS